MIEEKKPEVEFYGGPFIALVPLLIFVFGAFMCFIVFKVFDMEALAASALVSIILTALFAKNWGKYWEAARRGIAAPVASTIVLIFLVISIFARMMAASGVSQGFVWLGDMLGMHGGWFTMFTFITSCIVSMATGTSIGTVFSCFPILFPAGILLGGNPGMLAGAVISGALFGDNLAPISDTTIASAGTQMYSKKSGSADIPGCVATRFKYAIVAAIMASIGFVIFGGGGSLGEGSEAILAANMNPKALIMLIPVVLLLFVAMKTRDLFKSATVGIISGLIVGLIAGLLTPASIVHVQDGVMTGFVFEGVKGIMSTIIFTMSLFTIIGIMNDAGLMDMIVLGFEKGGLLKTPRMAEAMIGLGSCVVTALMGGVATASILMFGPITDKIGKAQKLHPYRRANLVDGYACSLPNCLPFLSAFVFIGAMLVDGLSRQYDFIQSVNPVTIAMGMLHPICLFVVLTFAVITGWGRRFEGENGERLKEKPKD